MHPANSVSLRHFSIDDVQRHNAGEDQSTVRWLTDGVASTSDSTRRWIDHGLEVHQGERTGEWVYAIEANGELAGMIALNPHLDGLDKGDINVSYAVYPPYRGHGIAGAAIESAAQTAAAMGMGTSLVIRAHPQNSASIRVAEKLDFTHIGTSAADGELVQVYRRPL